MNKTTYFLLTVTSSVVLFISGCGDNPCDHMNFEEFRNANRIEITDSLSNVLRKIQEPKEINALVEFAISHKSGWGTPWAGTPIASINANFYQGDNFLGDFGLGSNFLAAQGCGYFQSRSINYKDRATLIKLFGVAH